MLLKTKKGMSETKLKRTQNEPQLSAQMRETEPKFELFDIAHVWAGEWIVGDGEETEIARLGETRETAGEYENSGNEAKKSLKTKDRAVPNVAHWSGFCVPMTPNHTPKRAQTAHNAPNEPKAQMPRPRK
jgi:hypothetical protein